MVLHQVLHWVNSTVAIGIGVKLDEMDIWKMNEKIKSLLEHYQAKVAAIPEVRPLIMLHEESMLKLLTYLEYYCKHEQADAELMRECMMMTKGHMNPATVADAIKQWKETV